MACFGALRSWGSAVRLRAPVFRGSASRGSAVRRRGTFVVRLSEPGLGSAPQGHSVSELCSGARQCASGAPCFGARASRSSAVRHRSAVFRGSKAHAASSRVVVDARGKRSWSVRGHDAQRDGKINRFTTYLSRFSKGVLPAIRHPFFVAWSISIGS